VGRTAAVLVLCGLGIAGCPRDATESVSGPRRARPVTGVVARVGDRPILASEIETRMKSDGIGAEEALEELIDEELLIQEAMRQGYTVDQADERAIERLMVRALLHDIEGEITPESISEQEVRQDFAEHADKLRSAERRRSWHILVQDPSEAGEALAQSILKEARDAEDPRSLFERYAKGDEERTPLPVKAEELPAITRKASIEQPYKQALFAAKSTGLLKRPVKTSYGWHVIFLEEIIPAGAETVQDFEDQIRKRLAQKKRLERVVSIVDRLEAQGLVTYNDKAVKRLVSMAGLPKRAE
jgi:parvulin-like peptidyl-prolyl isomerase